MPRPRLLRRIRFQPGITYFKPAGTRMIELAESILTMDELEAIRLKDLMDLDQGEAAKKMNISQPTFNRLIGSARKKIADALVNGKAIKIEGGDFKMVQPRRQMGMGQRRGRGRGFGGRGRMGGSLAAGSSGYCICPNCGNREPHQAGMPCTRQKCSKCSNLMTRRE